MIKAVLFDMGGVVATNIEDYRYPRLEKISNLNKNDIKKRIKSVEHKFDVGKISVEDFFKSVAKVLDVKDYRKVKKIFVDTIMKKSKLNNVVIQFAKQLKEDGYKIGILSNTNVLDSSVHKKRKDFDLFSPVILSNEVGHRKPERKIYQIALNKLRVKPEECIFIDDKKSKLISAKKLGIKTILFKSSSQMKKDIKRLL